MRDLRRVRDTETGSEFSTRRDCETFVDLPDQPAVDANGRALPSKTAEQLASERLAGDGPFDPAHATVADVIAYLEGADDAERERVLADEADGKNRITVTGWEPSN